MVMQSVLRSLHVLEKVAMLQPARLGEIVPVVDLPKSTVQRSLETLAEAGWIRALDGDITRWEISPHVRGLLLRPSSDSTLIQFAQQPMTELRDLTGETVQLKLLNGTDQLTMVDHVDTRHTIRAVLALGTVLPILASSAGFAIMARFDADTNAEIVERLRNTPPFDPHFVVEDDALEVIAMARQRGYSIREGWLRDVVGIGAAILDRHGHPIAGVSLVVPKERYDPSKDHSWAQAVVATALRITALIGRASDQPDTAGATHF